MVDVGELGALADAHQADVETARANGRSQPRLIADVGRVCHRALETGRVDVGQVVGHDLQLALVGEHARYGNALGNFHGPTPYLRR